LRIGLSLVQELRTAVPGLLGIPPIGDKVLRVRAVSPLAKAGKVKLPAAAPWLAGWLDEHRRFPDGPHDDMVDTTSLALARLWYRKSRRATGRIGGGESELFG
jgi:predicted phage terminase large subunit-like protein